MNVVLPLLQDSVVATGWIAPEEFLSGYGAAQAIPGPMFAFSAYLGAIMSPDDNTYLMAATALGFVFLPGFLNIKGERHYLWRTVDHDGDVIDVLVQNGRDAS